MEALKKHIVRSLVLKALILCATSVLLFFVGLPLVGREGVVQQVPYLILLPTLFFALSLGGCAVYKYVMSQKDKHAVAYYLCAKIVRLFLAIAVLLIYAFADGRNLLHFSINLLVLYLAGMVTSIYLYVKVEQNMSKKQ